ncbi:MAG: hypothetical protein DDT19_00900 [Syntrophomonadaceae bacterium]|nr:hypothetical protein [Bacillota bacterium]
MKSLKMFKQSGSLFIIEFCILYLVFEHFNHKNDTSIGVILDKISLNKGIYTPIDIPILNTSFFYNYRFREVI